MTLLRILASLDTPPDRCTWVLVGDSGAPAPGEGPLSELPRHAEHVQLIIPAAQVLLTRTSLPAVAARRRTESMLAFAIEDQIAGEIDTSQAIWLGAAGDAAALAVVDRMGLQRWHDALSAVGIRAYEVHCETLLLPWQSGQWSLAWNGREGCIRTGQFEGAATDGGDRMTPPMALRLLLDEAAARSVRPKSINVYATAPDAMPDLDAWKKTLDIPLQPKGQWHWRSADRNAGPAMLRERRRWRSYAGLWHRLRPAAWIVGVALAVHAVALASDWALLAHEQRTLREQMVAQFRATFPDAVAVVNPVLQMRRKLAEARHAAGASDSGDFLPLVDKIAAALTTLPAGALRGLSYESGRMIFELSATDATTISRVVAHLQRSGLNVAPPTTGGQAANSTITIAVHAP